MDTKKDRKSTPKQNTSSGSGRGRKPRSGKGFRLITGGNPRKRNKNWMKIRKSDRFKATHSNKKNEPKEVEISCQVYLDTNDDKISSEFYNNLIKILEEQEFTLSRENPAKKGSWMKDFWVKSKRALTSSEVVDRLEKIERGIELKHIDKVQSEVDLNISQAISNLLQSTKEIPNFSTLVGSLLFAKATVNGEPIIFAQTLTQDQLKIVKENPSLINKPFDLINKMEEVKAKALSENKQKKIAGT